MLRMVLFVLAAQNAQMVASTPSSQPTPTSIRYRLKATEEMLRMGRLFGRALPQGRLVLANGGAFELLADGTKRCGKYNAAEGKLTLRAEDGSVLLGEQKDGLVFLEGLAFEQDLAQTFDVVGTWTVRQNGSEDRSCRMEFKKEGRFRFVMAGATSEGTWSLESGKILLIWTKVDGELVTPGTMRKVLPMSEMGDSFQIDTFRYERAITIK